ncbi:hypothetical protein B0H19DRAFT_1067403 [Mycena capillaripes]|nr:hypothetical protein B0H19DRAFT_1067403 [Mycena capillaripes]
MRCTQPQAAGTNPLASQVANEITPDVLVVVGLRITSRTKPISTAISEFAVATSNSPNEFKLLKVTNEGLALTNTGALPEMLPVEPPSSIRQNWAFECGGCIVEGSPGMTFIGEGCLVVSQFDGSCLNINNGGPVGSPVTLGNCQVIGSSINIYTAYLMIARIQLLIVNYVWCYLLLKSTVENSTSGKLLRNEDTSAASVEVVNAPFGTIGDAYSW